MKTDLRHLFYDAATGLILNAEGCVFAFEEYPERPQEFGSFAAAQEFVAQIKDSRFVLHLYNSSDEV